MTPEFDHYTISRVLGEGGMGLVYLAQDRRTGLPVAIKVMSRREFDPELRSRFLQENRILAAMNHRNIVRCYEITESRDGVPSLVMEYVDGVDFRAFEGRPFPELLPLMIQALMGLGYLRTQNVLHRDLSSNNIFVTLENRTRVTKILDFGVAKILQESGAGDDVRTRTGQFLGKFSFASPEHFLPTGVDWRSDVYSLGVIFHRLLTGKPPITVARKGNYFDWMTAHQEETFFEVLAPPGVPPLPDALRDVVRRMLARRPEDRPQSFEEVLGILDRLQRDLPPALEPDPLALRSLPPPVEGRIGASGSGKSPTPSSPAQAVLDGSDAGEDRETAGPSEESQQRRWPDLEAPISRTERFAPPPTPARAVPAVEPPAAEIPEPEAHFGAAPSSTELLPPTASREATRTGPTVVSKWPERLSEAPAWTGGAANDSQPVPAGFPSGLNEEKTERLDEVLEKLRQHSPPDLLPPLKPKQVGRPSPAPASVPAPPPLSAPTPSPSPMPGRPPSSELALPAAPSPKPARRLVIYGEAPPAAPASPPAVSRDAPRAAAPVAPAPAPAQAAADRRLRRIGIGLIVAAIVVLFAAILWGLVALLGGTSAGDSRSSSHAGPAAPVAATVPGTPSFQPSLEEPS